MQFIACDNNITSYIIIKESELYKQNKFEFSIKRYGKIPKITENMGKFPEFHTVSKGKLTLVSVNCFAENKHVS